MSFDYIRKYCDVPAERGRQVTCYGERGVIVGADGHYLCVVIDGDRSEEERRYHPTDKVVYGDIVDSPMLREWMCLPPWRDEWESDAWFTVTASTRSKARYKAFLDLSDVYDLEGKDIIRIRVKAVPKMRDLPRTKSPPEDDDLPF
ncbi:hypothetical protein NE850_18005 [Paraburkholderia sp. USG1]|uniref:hypothetical protein n=1 Tax=Paraburkholderia sp. USG1 TaxID=2952268 RepID=UPI00285883F9|nr:hypothetical protein [Paraburkholderia sp. USG1]MDR8398238.1 hypothetical protein [Paraburkholderia sp. USG1]